MEKLIVHSEAEAELEEIAGYYENVKKGLGREFKLVFSQKINSIVKNPYLFMLREGGYRRVSIDGFPYYLPYVIRKEVVWVMGVVHVSRDPCY